VDADIGQQALRTATVIRLLATTVLRVDEATGADVADLDMDKDKDKDDRSCT
jgi:integrase